LKNVTPVSLSLSVEVLRRREQLESLVMDLHTAVKSGLGHLELMRQEHQIMEKFEAQIQSNESFEYTVKQVILNTDLK